MDYIVTKNQNFFKSIGDYNYCSLPEMGEALTAGVGADSETTGLEARRDKIFALQFGTGKDNFLVDCQDYSTTIAFREYQGLCTTPKEVWPHLKGKHLVFHNGLFDIPFWMMEGFIPDPEYVWDTMIGSQALYNGKVMLRHNFGDMMERELGVVYDKSEQKNIHRVKLSTPKAISYCFQDVDRLKEAHEVIYKKLSSYGGNETYNLNRQTIVALSYMHLCGMPCSKRKWGAKIQEDKLELLRAEKIVKDYIYENLPEYRKIQYDLFGEDGKITCNLGSPQQMIPVFKKFGIHVETDDNKALTKKAPKRETREQKALREKGRKESIGEDVISFSSHEFVKLWLDYKDAQHNISNFGENILNVIEDGRIHLKFKAQVDTCRIASHKESPMNGLNIPANKRTRECFEANKGFKMIVADYEGQENVDLADLSRDDMMVASVVNNLDLHCAFARLAFPEIADLDDNTIKKQHKEKRDFVKSPRFLKAYGGGAFTMAKQCGMSMERAEFLSDKYDELHPGVISWGQKNLEINSKQGFIQSAGNWRLYLPFFDEFKKHGQKIDSMSRELKGLYRKGRDEYKHKQALAEKGEEYEITDKEAADVYKEWRGVMRRYFSLRGQYLRLSLNSPVQTTGAHQTKLALVNMYKYIVSSGHLWKARLSNSPYDEIVMEVEDSLTEEYKEVLGYTMRKAGDYYLKSGLVKMGAEANIGDSWYSAK